MAFATHINQCLARDELMARHLPINVDNDDLFTKGTDGIMYCKLINLAVAQTVDERALNKKVNPSIYQKIENLNLALNASKGKCFINNLCFCFGCFLIKCIISVGIGCQIVNIGAQGKFLAFSNFLFPNLCFFCRFVGRPPNPCFGFIVANY